MARRVRRHANPFNCTVELGALDRVSLFGREAPLEIELGPGLGGFLIERARNHPERDFVGIEVRQPVVEQVMARADRPKNAVVLYANANANLEALCPKGAVTRFHVHFPDPWVKKRHWKRRILSPTLVRAMAALLPLGGEVYAQSDVQGLAREMYRFLEADGSFASRLDPRMAAPRPIPERTDWERHHEAVGEPVYRMWFEKIREPSGPIPALDFGPTGPLVGA